MNNKIKIPLILINKTPRIYKFIFTEDKARLHDNDNLKFRSN